MKPPRAAKRVKAKAVWLRVRNDGEPFRMDRYVMQPWQDLPMVRYVPSDGSAEARVRMYERALREIVRAGTGHAIATVAEIGTYASRVLAKGRR